MAVNTKKDVVMDNLDKIKAWIANGVTIKQIADNLHISKQTLYKYLHETEEGLDIIKNSRQPAVEDLENTLYTSARGCVRTVKKYVKLKRCEYEEGRKVREWEELVECEEEVYFPPDTTAGIFLLKNWAGYMNEPKALEIRKKELELKEKQVW